MNSFINVEITYHIELIAAYFLTRNRGKLELITKNKSMIQFL